MHVTNRHTNLLNRVDEVLNGVNYGVHVHVPVELGMVVILEDPIPYPMHASFRKR